MKKLTQLALLLGLVLGFTSYSNAALLIEPVVGYNVTTKFDQEDMDFGGGATLDGSSNSGNGFAYGGRLGYQNLGFQLGLDYLNSSIKSDDDDLAENISMNEWGGFVGFEFPVLVRVYIGYIFSATGESESDDGDKIKWEKGSGTKFGIGFTGLPFIDVNLEYRRGTFTEFKAGDFEADGDTDYSSVMLGLSVPFTI